MRGTAIFLWLTLSASVSAAGIRSGGSSIRTALGKNFAPTSRTAFSVLPLFSLMKTGAAESAECAGTNLTPALGGAITLTRSTTATCETSTVVFSTMLANRPRVVTMGGLTGILIERLKTGILKRSAEINVSPWATGSSGGPVAPTVTADQYADPFGLTTAESVAYPVAAAGVSTYVVQGSIPSSGGGSKNAARICVKNPSGTSTIYYSCYNGGATNFSPFTTINATTSWACFKNENKADLTFCMLGQSAGLTGGIAAQTLAVWGADAEDITVSVGTYIPVVATNVVRNADVATITTPLTSSDSTFCLRADAYTFSPDWTSVAADKGIIQIGTTIDSANSAALFVDSTGHPVFSVRDSSATDKRFTATAALTGLTAYTLEGCNVAGTITLKVNGSTVAGTASGAGTGLITTMQTTTYIGSRGVLRQLDGVLANVLIDNQSPPRTP